MQGIALIRNLEREGRKRLGSERVRKLCSAPRGYRGWGTHDGREPLFIIESPCNLIEKFAGLIEQVPSMRTNWSAFLALAERAEPRDEFLWAAIAWANRINSAFKYVGQQVEDGRRGLRHSLDTNLDAFFDDRPGRPRLDPRIADELTALTLCLGDSKSCRIAHGAFSLVSGFYSVPNLGLVVGATALREIVREILESPRNTKWLGRYMFSASLVGGSVRAPSLTLDEWNKHNPARDGVTVQHLLTSSTE